MVLAGFAAGFAVLWLAVAGTTIAHYLRPRGQRTAISLLARAGLLIWSTAELGSYAAIWRHWPPVRISELQAIAIKCKLTGFVLVWVGLARQWWRGRSTRRDPLKQRALPPASQH